MTGGLPWRYFCHLYHLHLYYYYFEDVSLQRFYALSCCTVLFILLRLLFVMGLSDININVVINVVIVVCRNDSVTGRRTQLR